LALENRNKYPPINFHSIIRTPGGPPKQFFWTA
jgi:hypothetical protein